MASTDDLRYLETHEWHRLDGGTVTLGVSRFAVDELTDVTYVELPEVGDEVRAGDSIGEIESVKATSEVYTGVGGKVIEVNKAAVDNPSALNADPFGEGWLVRIEPSDPSEFENLMDGPSYEKKHSTG